MIKEKRHMHSRESKHLCAMPRITQICPQPPPLDLALKATWQTQNRYSKENVLNKTHQGQRIKNLPKGQKKYCVECNKPPMRNGQQLECTNSIVRWLSDVTQRDFLGGPGNF